MGKNKLQRFEEIDRFENVLELTDYNEEAAKPKGSWNNEIFGTDRPITLELACGKGEYTLELARRNPERNFVGIDIKGARIWKGAKRALEEGLENVRFLRIYIDHIAEYFGNAEVSEIWITFPDPHLNESNRNKRLSSAKFLSLYQQILKAGAPIHFKTDNDRLYDYTLWSLDQFGCTVLDRVDDVYAERPDDDLLTIKTYYEKKHLENGKTIHYVKFRLPELPA